MKCFAIVKSFIKTKMKCAVRPLTLSPFKLSCRTTTHSKGHTPYSMSRLPYMAQWKGDLESTFDLEEWHIANNLSYVSPNITLVESSYKLFMHWYMVPTGVAKMCPQASTCFRYCSQLGTMFQIWWHCPKLTKFWIRLFNLMQSVTAVNTTRNCSRKH